MTPGRGLAAPRWQAWQVGRRQRLILTLLFTAGIALFVAAGLVGNDDTPDTALSTPGVEGLIPGRGDEVLQQQRVGIDLEPGFRLVGLTISPDARCQSPVDVFGSVRRVEGLEQWFYQPAEGLPVEALAPDQNCVKARIEQIARPGEIDEVEWVFTVS